MTKKLAKIAAALEMAKSGQTADQVILEKAARKTARWMRAAHGDVNWNDEMTVRHILSYYRETEKKPEGKNTFNRQGRS